ncbi:MAG TPA: alpha/beta fold hydrolase [Acidiphilium sp.]|nr:MAG: alpha/beta hydrolase [Acidiphilium sp. 21-60-14]OYV92234.1 MAG: alpha/beta hydrolase [Acidiphilium sp. 37-60-79]OZB40587.1 MAG: alpha/beta hydrolase [Acidiphilium sp. 34-60-192]HQT87397.1 alpha/beta fold hydrolase [Acidiphilium sp.]HQU23103.1 alpha/beta fold hydrolase [Acidiphilium sp.]
MSATTAPRATTPDPAFPDWELDGADWPNRSASRFIKAGSIRFHVQILGAGPPILLLHGTGSATHSWRDLAPILAHDFTVIAPDLPGHGFTEALPWSRMSLPGMAAAVADLLKALGYEAPLLVIGHSAGAAIAVEMALEGMIAPLGIVSLNGALRRFKGVAGQIFSPLAKLMSLNPLVPRLFAWRATNPQVVARLLDGTGSRIDQRGADLYGRLARRSGHAGSALSMMANWELERVEADLPRLTPKLFLITGAEDRSIPPSDAAILARRVTTAKHLRLPGLGHLAHEEQPAMIAAMIVEFAHSVGAFPGGDDERH